MDIVLRLLRLPCVFVGFGEGVWSLKHQLAWPFGLEVFIKARTGQERESGHDRVHPGSILGCDNVPLEA